MSDIAETKLGQQGQLAGDDDVDVVVGDDPLASKAPAQEDPAAGSGTTTAAAAEVDSAPTTSSSKGGVDVGHAASPLGSSSALGPTLSELIRQGVPQPIIDTQMLYFDALAADAMGEEPGGTEEACRNTFAIHFASPSSPLSPHIDDMLWFVRTQSRTRDADGVNVFLLRRGLETDELLHTAEGEAGPPSSHSFSQQLSARFSALGDTTPPKPDSPTRGSSRLLVETPSGGEPIPTGIRWRESLALNIACQWTYTLSVSVVRRLSVKGQKKPVVIRNVTRRVYASPTRARFQHKEQRGGDEIDYPNLYFNVDDFEDCFGGIQLCEGYSFAVLLTAGESQNSDATVFRGLLNYDAIMKRAKRVVEEKGRLPTSESKEFIPLLGPDKKGKAEIAVCISDAELLSFANPNTAPSPSDGGKKNTTSSSGSSGGLFRAISNVFSSPKTAPKLSGNETLQCFLTYVSVHVQHVTAVLCTVHEVKGAGSWLYMPSSRKELDEILCDPVNQWDDELEEEADRWKRETTPQSPTGATPTNGSSDTAQERRGNINNNKQRSENVSTSHENSAPSSSSTSPQHQQQQREASEDSAEGTIISASPSPSRKQPQQARAEGGGAAAGTTGPAPPANETKKSGGLFSSLKNKLSRNK